MAGHTHGRGRDPYEPRRPEPIVNVLIRLIAKHSCGKRSDLAEPERRNASVSPEAHPAVSLRYGDCVVLGRTHLGNRSGQCVLRTTSIGGGAETRRPPTTPPLKGGRSAAL